MTKNQLLNELDYVNATRECRQQYANLVLANLDLVKPLLDIVFMGDKVKSPRAAWILEFAFKANNSIILKHLDYFCNNLSALHIDSAIRPCAKIIEILIENYYSNKETQTLKHLTSFHKELITENCFDWLINDQKIAVKAYSMTSLYLLGTEIDWIHTELRQIITQNYPNGSAGIKARSRHILKRIDDFNSQT